MGKPFDPYHLWLGIPAEEQPPHHYRLLGIPVFESDPKVIAIAAQRQIAHVKGFALGRYAECSQNILNRLTQAKVCLLNSDRKARYDAALRAGLAASPSTAAPESAAAASATATFSPAGRATVEMLRQWTIGSAPDCDVVVNRPTVSRRHCRLMQAPNGYFLEDLNSTNGTFVNGRKLTGRLAVCVTDKIRLGLKAPMPWPPEVPPSDVRLIRIGAGPDNDLVIDQPMVSWHHAVVRFEAGRAILEDLGSTNGTAIGSPENKVRRSDLSPGTTVYLGSHPIAADELLRARTS